MSATPAPPADSTAAGRVRRVAGRLLGPWGWCFALLGLALAVAPGDFYFTPSEEGRRDPSGPTWPAGLCICAGRPGWLYPPEIDDRHRRAIGAWIAGPSAAVVDRRNGPGPAGPLPAERRWVGEWSAPAWGLSGKQAFRGDLDPEDLYPDPAGGEAYRVASFQAGAIWLAGVPLLWSLIRLRHGVRNGWDAPAGRWRRAARPWGLTGAVIGAAALALGPGDSSGSGHEIFDGVDAMATVRRDPFSPGHPRFLRLALDLPTPPSPKRGEYDLVPDRPPPIDWGDRTRGVQCQRHNGLRTDFQGHVSYVNPFDVPRQGGTKLALDVSLWYALLPAALWSGVVLWRSRAGRMRPA